MKVSGQRNVGRPKLRWRDVIQKGMTDVPVGVMSEEAQGHITWRMKLRKLYAQNPNRKNDKEENNIHKTGVLANEYKRIRTLM